MKTSPFVWLAFSILTSVASAQDAPQAAATPPLLPPPPWLKRAPEFSQWAVEYKRDTPPVKPSQTPVAGTDRKSVQVTKTQETVLETTVRDNGAVVARYCFHGQILSQVNKKGEWIASGSVSSNVFNETDYSKSDFAGFDWISAKNYIGIQPVNSHKCLVFQDKVATIEQQDLDSLRSTMDQAVNAWEAERLRASTEVKNPYAPSPAGNKGRPQPTPPPPKPAAPVPRPPAFNLDDYKVMVTAYIDVDSGMPVAMTYKTLQGGKEGRTYSFQAPPTAPLELPPEVKSLVATNRAVLRRMNSRGAIP